MARQEVVQVQCDRCKRVSLVPKKDEVKEQPDFHARLGTIEVVYPDICSSCHKTLENLFLNMKEWDREVKQSLLSGPQIGANQAPPLDVPPNYTPPKPHSTAGAKRS